MRANHSLILCATDFGQHAVDAATVAAKIALLQGARLRLVHVTDGPTTGAKEMLRSRLDREAKRLQKTGVDVEALLLNEHQPMEAFLSYIHQEEPSLVVVGCNVKGPIDRWGLGSFSGRIAQSSTVPTLVIRLHGVAWTRGFAGDPWIRHQRSPEASAASSAGRAATRGLRKQKFDEDGPETFRSRERLRLAC